MTSTTNSTVGSPKPHKSNAFQVKFFISLPGRKHRPVVISSTLGKGLIFYSDVFEKLDARLKAREGDLVKFRNKTWKATMPEAIKNYLNRPDKDISWLLSGGA